MPIKDFGLAWAMHFIITRRPIPGSIMIGIAPIKRSAKQHTIRSYPGFTNNKDRSDFLTPLLLKKDATFLTSK